MGIEFLVLHVGRATPDVHRVKLEAALEFIGARGFVFGDDHNGGGRDGHPRILIGRGLDAAGHHQADVHAIGHPVGIEAIEQALDQFLRCDADIHEDRLGPFIEPLDVGAQKRNAAADHAQAFPHAIAKDEA